MKNINFKKTVLVCALSLGSISAANATTGTFDVGFRTITDVTITETQALNFGATMYATSGGVCSMGAAAGDINDTDSGILGGAPIAGGTAGNVSGTGCITTAAGASGNQLGIYTLFGITGADIKVTVNEVVGADFSYTPDSGCVANHVAGATNDTCDTFFTGSPVTVTTSDATDGTSLAGETNVVLGGKVTVNTDLSSDTNYTQQFTIVATY